MGKSYEPTDGRQAAVELNRTLEAVFFSEGFDMKPASGAWFFWKTDSKTWELGGVMFYVIMCFLIL
jgi:hypothetical protein